MMIVWTNAFTIVVLFAKCSFGWTFKSTHYKTTPFRPSPIYTKNDNPMSQTDDEVRAILKDSRESVPTESLQDFAKLDAELIDSLRSKRPYLSLVSEQILQTIDDYQLSKKIYEVQKEASANLEATRKLRQKKRPKVVVLGTGWGAYSLLKAIDATMYEVVVISPRNHFLFTPMLAASAVGTVEFRSITEPIRNVNPLIDYLEAQATFIDIDKKTVDCMSVKCEGTACEMTEFNVTYDQLVVAVGATSNTFGIKGVKEHCQFLKQVEDAASLRKSVAYCFERANVPSLTEKERADALSFVIVGAGPTGVEFTAELRDFMETEGRRYYPDLLRYVRITLIEAGGAVLQMLDETLQREALKSLISRSTTLIRDGYIEKEMVTVMLKTGVKEVTDTSVLLTSGEKIDYGFCLWAAGNGPVPLVLDLIEKIPRQKEGQSKARGRLVTDSWLRVEGCESIFSFGDCSFIDGDPLPATAQVASQQGAYLGRLLSRGFRMSAMPIPFRVVNTNTTVAPVVISEGPVTLTAEDIDKMSSPQFATDLIKIGGLGVGVGGEPTPEITVEVAKPFQFLNLGVLAYVGASEALAQIAVDKKFILGSGPIGFFLWRGVYWSKQVSYQLAWHRNDNYNEDGYDPVDCEGSKAATPCTFIYSFMVSLFLIWGWIDCQVSWRNRVLVAFDWIKGRLFGRDIGALYL